MLEAVAKFWRLRLVEPAGGKCASEPEVADDPERPCREVEAPVEGRFQGPPLRSDPDPALRLGASSSMAMRGLAPFSSRRPSVAPRCTLGSRAASCLSGSVRARASASGQRGPVWL